MGLKRGELFMIGSGSGGKSVIPAYENKIVAIEAERDQWKQRWEMANRMCASRADERVKIAQQLLDMGYNLDGDGRIIRRGA